MLYGKAHTCSHSQKKPNLKIAQTSSLLLYCSIHTSSLLHLKMKDLYVKLHRKMTPLVFLQTVSFADVVRFLMEVFNSPCRLGFSLLEKSCTGAPYRQTLAPISSWLHRNIGLRFIRQRHIVEAKLNFLNPPDILLKKAKNK